MPAVDRLSLEQQVGRMVILRFAGTEPPEYVRRALREGRTAGAVLFRDNVADPAQLRRLTRALRRDAPDALICVDQEGGAIRIVPWAEPERSAPEQQAWGTVREDSEAAGARPARRRRLRHARSRGRRADRRGRGDGRARVHHRPRRRGRRGRRVGRRLARGRGGDHGQALPRAGRRDGQHRRRAGGDRAHARAARRRPPAVRDGDRHGDRVRDGRPRHLSRPRRARTSPRSRPRSSTGCCATSSASRAWR